MDVVGLGLAKADAKKNYGRLTELRRRRPRPMNLTPMSAHPTPPTRVLGKGSGVSAVSVASGGSGYVVGERITISGGTTAYPAILQVTSITSGAVTGAAVVRPGIYSVNPTNPASQASTTGSGTGATFTLTFNGGVGSSITDGTSVNPTNAAIRFWGNGPANISSSGFYGNLNGGGTACIWEWCTDAPLLDIRILGFNCNFTLFVDGRRLDDSNLFTDASGAVYLHSLDWSGVRKPRTYRLVIVNSAFGGLNIPNNATVWRPVEPKPPLAWSLGDSYTYGTGTDANARSAIMTMAELLGLDLLPDGIGGTGWANTGSNDPVTRVNTKLATITEKPDVVFLDLGYNNNAATDLAAIAASFDATVAAVRAIVPQATVIAFGPATPIGTTTGLDSIRNTISGRCAALGVAFVDVLGWVTANNRSIYTGVDNTHPTQAGHDYLGGRRAQVVANLL